MTFKFKTARALALIAGVATLATAAAGSAAAANRYVLVVNQTDHTLTNLYAAGKTYGSYNDWLGNDTLAPGDSKVVDFDDGSGFCRLAVVGKFSDGDVVTERSFNVCSEARLVFTGD